MVHINKKDIEDIINKSSNTDDEKRFALEKVQKEDVFTAVNCIQLQFKDGQNVILTDAFLKDLIFGTK